MLWPYEWKVTGSNLDRHELTFSFLPNLVWRECEKVEVPLVKGVGKL